MRKLTLTLLCVTALLRAEDYALGPDSQPQAGVAKGTVTKYKLEPRKFYPGTPHDYWIYVPAQYDTAKPAPFMIFLDGGGSLRDTVRVPVVFDNLIAKHDLPPLIGIFVDPRGKVYSTVSADKPWEQVGETYTSVSSPAGDKDGNVFFADPAANRIYKSDTDRKVSLFKDNTSGATALRAGPDGRLYASQLARKRILSYGAGGDEKVVAQKVEANDLAITAGAGILLYRHSSRDHRLCRSCRPRPHCV
jgi:hypothetical protein